MIIMEKPEDSSNVHDYLLLETVGTKTLQKELNEARGKAYELAAMSSDGCEERPHGEALPKTLRLLPTAGRLPPPPAPHMLKEINDAVSKGYAVAAGSGGDELIIIMEKATNAPDISSWLTSRSPSLEKEINAAGWGASSSPLP